MYFVYIMGGESPSIFVCYSVVLACRLKVISDSPSPNIFGKNQQYLSVELRF